MRVATTTILRAACFKAGLQASKIDTHTYIFLSDVIRQPSNPPGFPLSWNGFAADYQMDPKVVTNSAYSGEIIGDLRSIPTMSVVLNPPDLFGATNGIYTFSEMLGDAWERAASVELIKPDGTTGFQADCGIRIWGTGWRPHSSSPKHALQLKFQDQYGPKKLHYPLFADAPIAEFDNIVLRAQGSRSWCDFRQPDIEQTQYIHDAFARDSARDMGKTDGHATYVHLYLNGLYWGLYNPVERTDEGFAEVYFGGDKSEYDVITRRDTPEADAGDLVAWNTMLAIANGGVATADRYELIQQGDTTKQIAVLEMGWTTDARPGSQYAWFAVDRDQQAKNLVGAFSCARERWQPWMGFMTVIYIPDPSWNQQQEQYWWSITNPDGGPRPAYTALKGFFATSP